MRRQGRSCWKTVLNWMNYLSIYIEKETITGEEFMKILNS